MTGGEGSRSLSDAHRDADHLTTRMVERAQRISALRAKTMSGWRGNAGEAAADATLPLVQAAADDAVHLKNAQSAVAAQMEAFGTAKYSVKPVPAQPPALDTDDVLRAIRDDKWDSYNTKVAGWQADSQANIDAFSAYHSASNANGGQMPAQYAQLADFGGSVSMRTSDRTGGPTDTGEWARNPRQTEVPAQDRHRPTQDRITGGNREQTPNQQNQQNQLNQQNQQFQQDRPDQNQAWKPGTPDSSTHANSYLPRPVLPTAQGGYEFGPTGQPVSNLTNPGPNWSGGFGPGTGPYTGASFPPGTTGTPGSNRGTGTPGGRFPGSSTGARLPEERLPGTTPTRGSTGPRGANGLPMGGAPMGGRGGKEEDREKKKAPYLQNPDPDETFGGFTEKPMPPVIGENKKR
ncbi:PPE domain-containing protein [Amycolatopsis plumensis]|uniref:PPE domain-containing protein n=1 Tax=Amycolatopsis plumensis TaxID=236508 RepID=UPI00360DD9D9